MKCTVRSPGCLGKGSMGGGRAVPRAWRFVVMNRETGVQGGVFSSAIKPFGCGC